VATGSTRRDLDEARVLAVEDAYDRAWCAGDIDAPMQCFTADAVLVSPRGQVAIGTEAIRELLGAFLTVEAHASSHESTMDRITFAGDDVAVFDGHAAIVTQSDVPVLAHPFTDVLVRTDSGWRIAHVRAYHFEPNT
jgi:uncharacterized protein (TIGR02246 family)